MQDAYQGADMQQWWAVLESMLHRLAKTSREALGNLKVSLHARMLLKMTSSVRLLSDWPWHF